MADQEPLYDRAKRKRSPATYPAFRKGKKPRNEGRTYGQEVYEPDELLRLVHSLHGTAPAVLRERALYAFMWRTGVRTAEVPAIRELDLDPESGFVRIRATKTRPEREVYLFGSRDDPEWAWDQLRPWLDVRSARGVVRSAPVFCVIQGPTRGDAWGPSAMRTDLHVQARRAGLHGRWHLRGFRNSLAAELYRGGLSVATIRAQLGLQTVASTQQYLEKIGVMQTMDDPRDYRPPWVDEE